MLLIRPMEVTPSALASSNVPEDEAVWSDAATYAEGAIVRGDEPETAHTLFMSSQADNTNHPVTDTDWWAAIGPTNRWRMFDASVTTQTENPESIVVEIDAVGRVDSVTLLNLNGATARVVMEDSEEGVVFDQTYSLVSPYGIIDWHSYFFEPIERLTDLSVTDMPPYANAEVTVSVFAPGGTAKCGACVIGLSRMVGETAAGAGVGIIDFSRKERNAFGEYLVRRRDFSKRATFQVLVENGRVDQLQTLLATYRATPIVYRGSEAFGSTLIYGFYRDFNIEIAYPTHSLCSLEIEGLT